MRSRSLRLFLLSLCLGAAAEEQTGRSWALPGPLESLGIGRMSQTAPPEAVGCTIDVGQDGKTEILVDMRGEPNSTQETGDPSRSGRSPVHRIGRGTFKP